jgi:hypothetical protein
MKNQKITFSSFKLICKTRKSHFVKINSNFIYSMAKIATLLFWAAQVVFTFIQEIILNICPKQAKENWFWF